MTKKQQIKDWLLANPGTYTSRDEGPIKYSINIQVRWPTILKAFKELSLEMNDDIVDSHKEYGRLVHWTVYKSDFCSVCKKRYRTKSLVTKKKLCRDCYLSKTHGDKQQ